MPIVTALLQSRRRGRVAVYLDGAFALSAAADALRTAGVVVGATLAEREVAALREADALQQCLQAAYRFLAYRPRTEAEVRSRLQRRGDPPARIETVVRRLKQQRLLDDAAFAADYAARRLQTAPRSRRMVSWELRRKGVDAATVEEAVAAVDDEDAAYRAAARRVGRLASAERQEFRDKLGSFLVRRGFSYAVAARVVDRLWRELGSGGPGGE